MDYLRIKGAREHNLKNIDITLPRDKFIVITGLSGSGKSSLAFDTIYAEGQRRYVESLSSYARQFLGQMEKPDVDLIEGLSPAISIDQKTTARNPRSTVGTVTEIHDYLRLLYARAGEVYCTKCGKKISRQTVDQMVDQVMKHPEGTKLMILAPVIRAKKGEHKKVLEGLAKEGYVRAVVDGETVELDTEIKLEKQKKHSVSAVVDRIIVKPESAKRAADSIETALRMADGLVIVRNMDTGKETLMNENFACADCGVSIEELSPRMFSFNSPFGACPECTGLGMLLKIDPDLIVPDKTKTLREGAVKASGWNFGTVGTIAKNYLDAMMKRYHFDMDTPYEDLPAEVKHALLYGTDGEKLRVEYDGMGGSGHYNAAFEGIIPNLERRYAETTSEYMKGEIEGYMVETPCPICRGQRYKPETLAVKIGDKNIAELSDMSIRAAREYVNTVKLSSKQKMIAERVLKELNARFDFLINVGLDYLTLSRAAGTLSGGEAQRIRLATQIGSGLMGVLYILDEPSIGLHQKDNDKLLATLKGLRDIGNTLIVVEHDEETMLNADHIVDIGPGAGAHGGKVVAEGTPEQIMANKKSITGQYLSGKKLIRIPAKLRKPKKWITVRGAKENNLKDIDVSFPTGVITAVTGVSGSGKSSLVNHILKKAAMQKFYHSKDRPGRHDRIDGLEYVDKIVDIDQSPIGRTPRSNPATYTGLFDIIRDIFAMTQDAKARGYQKGRFSFNVKGGRCEACRGDGIIKIEMHFLPDVYVPCEVCKGQRYNRETLEVRYKGKNIFEVLDMTVEEAYKFFENIPRIESKLKVLLDVGLSYIKLGQPSTTLSGGEAQRVKLATHLAKKQTGNTLFILDEPTTGLHMDDVKRLVKVLNRLADKGNTVVVIEHNLDVIKSADYIIDMGPDGGDKGGTVIAKGAPKEVAETPGSYTGEYLKRIFDNATPEHYLQPKKK
ncbi:excinuclease ABC subunit UvrA [Christensenella minuta]|uniref:excinuclease ABC subunit UvrA n=1 Tax=Christensenella minuta TaxID=626937 RepID=UPI002A80A98F|nr:excinuclease ABC subunit UvrA [Christensenella minuta]MDY3752024.1 excinuclease ABC subunit UvrA [Christensenella minuta]